MRKIIIFLAIIISISTISILFGAADNKDFVLDPKTSTLIPKYLGKIKILKGEAFSNDRELKVGAKIFPNENVYTKKNSLLVIDIIDNSTVTIGPESEFKVENWNYRTKEDRDAVYNVVKGQFRVLVKSKAPADDQIFIKTKQAAMGIRGTELLVNENEFDKKEITQVILIEGKIHLKGEKPDDTKDLKPGDNITIIKSDTGTTKKEERLSDEEMKSLQEFSEPNVPKLYPMYALLDQNNNPVTTTSASLKSRSNEGSNSALKIKAAPEKSLKENLDELNTTRKKNLQETK